ncbi:hypothetical protein [Nocardia seriolae]|uniref:Uncharacterized protein n=1 Tax=Nocardia seriolae TaxID=37332 RepID=A0A0B8NC08_9NOCA|nr:hypothetical protein [Nocardia seriolae]APA97532.1 hypothetical protein NS506_03480 [Nocardia seriolae]MTJ62426.1 hypothetical protein [Nocardia seriolae]MTJ74530.1 hypothetical protein [Nocardia seriolae]MTJ87329.1 hypothetical protein [Nocardia seriolae]MTK31323.1 hypothetical protein [Nocardia seriolae]
MSGLSPLALTDLAVLGALNTADGLGIEQIAIVVAAPPSGPGMSLNSDATRRILTRLEARGLAENEPAGWRLTRRGRALWATKGSRFTL